MNVLGCIYLAAIAFSVGHAIGWHRGSNYEHDRTEASRPADPAPHQEVDRSPPNSAEPS